MAWVMRMVKMSIFDVHKAALKLLCFWEECGPFKTDQICGAFKAVSGSTTDATNSVQKCAKMVYDECSYKEFFSFRIGVNACHCVEQPNCDTPKSNPGLNIYTVDTCLGMIYLFLLTVVLQKG